MAIVRDLEQLNLGRVSEQTDADCTYSIIETDDGTFLQVDTYGSRNRTNRGEKSQSIRFAPEALRQLRRILERIR